MYSPSPTCLLSQQCEDVEQLGCFIQLSNSANYHVLTRDSPVAPLARHAPLPTPCRRPNAMPVLIAIPLAACPAVPAGRLIAAPQPPFPEAPVQLFLLNP